jgi:uncharacterized spore protein YtfJ
MGFTGQCAGHRPFRIETVQGEPYYVGGRKLIPVARVISFGKASATIGTERIGGWGVGFAQVTPLAVVEETDEGERRMPLVSTTSRALQSMFAGAVAITLFFTTIRWLVRRRRKD